MRRYLLLGILLLMLVHDASAISIGVNRASVVFTDVLRGGYARSEMVVTTDSEDPIAGEIIVYPSEASPWLNFSVGNFTFSKDAPQTIYVDVQPPRDAQVTAYRVNVSILTGELTRSGGGLIGTSTRASLGVPVLLSMTGTERLACQVGGLRVLDTERGQPIQVELSVVNTGNVRVTPTVQIEVYDKYRSEQLGSRSQGFGSSVLPTLTETRTLSYAFDLQRDQYWATVSVPECGFTGVQTFDVLDAGEVKDDGDFIRIDAQPWAEVGDIIPINAVFRNRGARAVRASFRGTVTHADSGEIAKVINTDEYIVGPSTTANLETFFNPVEPGQYMVTGKVFYNDKLTIERNAILNVNGAPIGVTIKGTTIILGALVLAILVLLFLILRRRARRR